MSVFAIMSGIIGLIITIILVIIFLRQRIAIQIGIIGVIIVLVVVYFLFWNDQCGTLKKHGFEYNMTGGASPTWDIVVFFFKGTNHRRVEGPLIAGSCLKVRCLDIDDDGIAEFIVQSQVTETYQTVLKVDIDSGNFHVHHTKGLKVGYPQEGYNYH